MRARVKFAHKAFAKDLYNAISKEQTKRLIEYAKKELVAMVESHEFNNRTGHAQDSYVWIVCHDGKKTAHGYYDKKMANGKSYLHEWSKAIRTPVNGRNAAIAFFNSYKPTTYKGWEIVWCAAAPYLGYHEGGFHIRGKAYHFNVMSQRYDHIKNVLEPKCKVKFHIYQPKY